MSHANPAVRVFGWLLTILGGLWVLLTGGCTLVAITAMGAELSRDAMGSGLPLFGIYLMIGAVCVAPGAGLLVWGRSLLRKSR